ncbi:MAG TPA: acyl carrier protein [Mycobacterium sp.]|jgi:acyl carrier protein|nr:acyl carrier protein [Mycobacterium sp.]
MTAIQNDVLALVTALAPAPAAEPDLHRALIDDLGYTSLRLLELCIAVEHAFALPPLGHDMLAGVSTVGDLVNLVRTQRNCS